ncbi:AsmA family protein [Parachryseolinea silvisoli]|uniref:AsmA family protein n=1 Tax=Parachryseolinea silvisoli TaxID=2873601 RepID=UPI0022659C70|nr:AsmA-like C-terminal region-containing protein [Parachryseolinea silvisoli]MCD9016800.1 AsmA family protein [Parachryseolinea silvisoli]
MKTVRKIFFYLVLTLVVLLLSLTASVFLFKDKIIRQFIEEANKNLQTPVKIGQMDVSVFEKFPQISIVLRDVYVEDSHPGQYPLLTASTLAFQLHPLELWRGKYTIRGVQIHNSETNLRIDAKGQNNYTIFKATESDNGTGGGGVTFELSHVALKKTRFHYVDLHDHKNMTFTSDALDASIHSVQNVYHIKAHGQLITETLDIGGSAYLAGKNFTIDSDLAYDDQNRLLTINPSTLKLKKSSFAVRGSYGWQDDNIIDLTVDGQDTDIQTIVSLLPESATHGLEKYQSKGDVYFSSTLKGVISRRKSPAFSVKFGFDNATIYHPEYKSRIEEATLEGSFASGDITDLSKAVLILKNVQGKLNHESFVADFVLQNFNDPEVICHFKGRVDAGSLLDFYPVENVSDVSGYLFADVSFEGKVGLLKRRATAQKVSTQGTIELQEIRLKFGAGKIPLEGMRGNLQFSNNDLALSNVSGKLGNSDFLLNGFFKNIITFLLFENQPIGIETDLKSNYIDMNQLLAIGFGQTTGKQEQEYAFSISKNINLNFNCDVKAMTYKRFHATNLTGDLLVKNEMAVSRNITLHAMGGDMMLSGIIDAKNKKAIDVVSTCKVNGVYLDSAFYVFENFQQSFIEDKHLRGRAYADVNLEMALKPSLRLFPETLIADIGVSIKGGELNNFEPMQKLNRYVNDKELSHLRFSDIKNDIHIENKTIYIPQMEIRTNVTSLRVSGTHTFDQQIDYRVITPLRLARQRDPEAMQAVEEDASGSKLYLKITGTADNYRVQYDTDAVKKKIVSDLKNEVKELKDAFKNKGTQKKKEAELAKDEYFEWDE